MDENPDPRQTPRELLPSMPGLCRFDADLVLRRSNRPNLGLWMSLLLVASGTAVALAGGHWVLGIAMAVFLLPDRILALREERDELRALAARDDFLEALGKRVEGQLLRERSSFFLKLGLAGALALLARTQPDGSAALVVAAAILAYAIVRFAVVTPPLSRELADLGGETPAGWILALIFATFVVAAPFLVLYGLLRRTVRRACGLPAEPEPESDPKTDDDADDDEDPDAESRTS
jgi:hypothetical protein